MDRHPQLMNPRTRGMVVYALKERGEWHGRRGAIKFQFALSDQPTLEGERVEWRARVAKVWYSGKAGTVFDAIWQIERIVFQDRSLKVMAAPTDRSGGGS